MGFWQDKLQAIKKVNIFQKIGFVVVILFIIYSLSGGLQSIQLNRIQSMNKAISQEKE